MGLAAWLRRLVGARSLPGAESERRMWVRFPCQFPADGVPVRGPGGERWSVAIIDVSRGGFRMSAEEPVQPGVSFSVELPGPGKTAVLAYVVHVTPGAGGKWQAGCAFATEISKAELNGLAGGRVEPQTADRRTWERAACERPICYQVLVAEAPKWSPATIVDVSAGGVALRVDAPVNLGEVLRLELRGGDAETASVLLASVVRTTEVAGGWLLGCSFGRELTEDELERLLE